MLGKVFKKQTDKGVFVTGYVATREIAEDFRLVPLENRQSKESPTHNIMCVSSIHGKEYYAGKAWEGVTQASGLCKFDLVFEIVGTAMDSVKMIALEQAGGEYDILPPRKKEAPVTSGEGEQGAAQAA